MAQDTAQLYDEAATERGSKTFLNWSVLFAAGWLIYEITAQPNLGAVIVCAKFGWTDFRAALWLRRIDPNRPRARACFWLYLASGLWKIAMTATLTIFAFAFLAASLRPAQPPVQARAIMVPSWLPGAFLTAVVGLGLSTLTSCWAFELARHHGLKLWLSPAIDRARRANAWPTLDGDVNRAGRLLLTALVSLFSVVVITLGMVLGPRLGKVGPFAVMLFILLLLSIGTVVVMILRDLLAQLVIARTPRECWQTDELLEGQAWDATPP